MYIIIYIYIYIIIYIYVYLYNHIYIYIIITNESNLVLEVDKWSQLALAVVYSSFFSLVHMTGHDSTYLLTYQLELKNVRKEPTAPNLEPCGCVMLCQNISKDIERNWKGSSKSHLPLWSQSLSDCCWFQRLLPASKSAGHLRDLGNLHHPSPSYDKKHNCETDKHGENVPIMYPYWDINSCSIFFWGCYTVLLYLK